MSHYPSLNVFQSNKTKIEFILGIAEISVREVTVNYSPSESINFSIINTDTQREKQGHSVCLENWAGGVVQRLRTLNVPQRSTHTMPHNIRKHTCGTRAGKTFV